MHHAPLRFRHSELIKTIRPQISQQPRIKPSHPDLVCDFSNPAHPMSSLLNRLKNLQIPVESENPSLDLSQYALCDMVEFKLDFGKAHLGDTYQHIWETDQGYVRWFIARWGNSTKMEHRVFLHYLECKIDQAELKGDKIAVPRQANPPRVNQGEVGRGKSSSAAALQAKSKVAPKAKAPASEIPVPVTFDISEEEDDLGWTVMPEQVQGLEQRMTQMEGAINTIVMHLENMATQQTLQQTGAATS